MAPSEFHGADGIDPKDQGSELIAFALPHDFGSNIAFLDAKARRLLKGQMMYT
jgi:prepilin-type processing-associated H-X9-DG protein